VASLGEARYPCVVAVVGNQAASLVNFRSALLEEMVRRGATVFALAPDFDRESRRLLRRMSVVPVDISMNRGGLNPLRETLDIVRLARLLRRLRVTATFAYFIKPVVYTSVAARLAGIDRCYGMIAGLGYLFVEDRGRFSVTKRLIRSTLKRLFSYALPRNRVLFFQNPDDRDYFLRRGYVDPANACRVYGSGVDLDHFHWMPPPPGATTFVLAARLLAEKGIREYVEAARRIRAAHPEARFLLLGGLDAANRGAISQREVGQWVQEGVVEWWGHAPDVRVALRQSSVFVLPSYYREGTPRSILEAMAVGRPIVTTDMPGCRETVRHGENGLLIPPRDAEALFEAMVRFIRDPSLVGPMGRKSRELAEALYDVHAVNDVVLRRMGLDRPAATGVRVAL